MVCSKCNHEYEDTLDRCPLCGEPNPSVQASAGGAASQSGAAGPEAGQGWSSGQEGYRNSSGQGATYQAPPRQESRATSGPPARLDAYSQSGPKPSTVLVLGILSILFPFVGIVLAILALIWGSKAKNLYQAGDANYNMAQAGWVLGIVGLVYQAILIVYFVVVIGFVMDIVRTALSYSSGLDFSDFSDFYPYY